MLVWGPGRPRPAQCMCTPAPMAALRPRAPNPKPRQRERIRAPFSQELSQAEAARLQEDMACQEVCVAMALERDHAQAECGEAMQVALAA